MSSVEGRKVGSTEILTLTLFRNAPLRTRAAQVSRRTRGTEKEDLNRQDTDV